MDQKSTRLTQSVLLLLVVAFEAIAADSVDFASQVWPILQGHCIKCHGPNQQESNYRLDFRESALGGGDLGEAPIVPGNAAQSPLYQFVSGRHVDGIVMPPEEEATRLTPGELQAVKNWIDAGAPWPDELAGRVDAQISTDHWSFQPVARVEPPKETSSFIKTPIDAFVARRLHAANLTYSEPADRVTWIRRIYLDMHGLPPTARQVAAFVNDDAPDAYARVIDDVLGSSHYGERWARHWLDVVRFGESTGFEVNRDRENAYYFRDYVIQALNSDKSYRDFIIDQLAGDVAGDEVGTGFLVGGPYDMVKSPDVNLTLMQRQDELADFVNTTGTAFLALTIGCARCHNHKFDPISQRDYYAMQAVFAGVQHGERELRSAAPPDVLEQIREVETRLGLLSKQFEEFKSIAASLPDQRTPGALLPAVNAQWNVENFAPVAAKFIRFSVQSTSGAEPCLDELEIFSVEGRNVALSTEGGIATASSTLPGYAIHKLEHLNDGKYGNAHSWICATTRGWVQIELPTPVKICRIEWGRDREGGFSDRLAREYSIEVATEPGAWRAVATSAQRESDPGAAAVDDAFIAKLPESQAMAARDTFTLLQATRAKLSTLRKRIPTAYVGTFAQPERIRRLHRGDPLSPREDVAPDAVRVIGSLDLGDDATESARRLALADWIASPDNPLTARVIVNRVWQHHFGTGLVSTPSDFGKNGTAPSHPRLLDWMAYELMRNGWSLKWLHREILSSHVYQQASKPRADAIRKDADSRLLWRFPPRRLEAEAIRDCVLQVAGTLNPAAGGPGFLLFEIDHENVHHYFPREDFGPEQFRRMIYMTKIRQEQDDVFGVFDCPDGGQVIPNRGRSTTPLQALSLLNSKFMLQQCNHFADRVVESAGDDVAAQVTFAFLAGFSRAPDPDESRLGIELVNQHGLLALCRAILNANEFLFLN